MRIGTGLAVVSLVLGLGAVATAGDDPATRLDDLARRLLAADPAARERAEHELAATPPEDLRTLVRLLRDRVPGPGHPDRDPFVGAEIPPAQNAPVGTTQGVTFEVRFLALEPDVAARWLGCPTGSSRTVTTLVPPANVERLVGRRADGSSRVVVRNTLTAFDGGYVTTSIANQVAYVADFDVRGAAETGTRVADPRVATVADGLYAGLRGRRRGDGAFHVDVDVRGAVLQRPIPAVEFPVSGFASPVRIQVPTTTGFRIRTAADVPDRGSFLVGDLGPSPEIGGSIVALVTVLGVEFPKPAAVPAAR